jgi:hypothetical protein
VALEKDGENFLDRSCDNKEMLRRVKEKRNFLHKTQRRMVNWFGHILNRNCLLEHVIERQMKEKKEGKRK